MNPIVATVLLNTFKLATSGKLVDHTVELVRGAMSLALSGAEKRQVVLDGLKSVGGDLAPVVAGTAGYLLNLGIELAVAYVQAHVAAQS